MSIPAVLYDHVPVDDLQCDSDTEDEIAEVTIFVSSMFHRTSAPREEHGDGGNGAKNTNQSEQSRFVNNEESSNQSKEGVVVYNDCDSKNDNDIDAIQNDETDYRPMETIIENIDLDYVLVPIPPPTMTGDLDNILSIVSHTRTSSIRKKLKFYGKALLRAATRSSRSNNDRTTISWKTNDTIAKCVSGCASASCALLKPLQLCSKFLMPSSIYSSYDWVSETVIDGSGNRLILPGSCINLDESRNRITENGIQNQDEGMLIVPAGSDSSRLNIGMKTSSTIPVDSSSESSSLWTSKTIMVSAHDLLAVKHAQHMQMGDRGDPRPISSFDSIEEEEKRKSRHSHYYYRDDEFSMDHSTIMVATTQHITQQWTRALWKLAQRKADVWYYMSRSCLRRSFKNVGRLIIYPRQVLVQYYNSNNRRSYRSLTSNDSFANSEDHLCSIDNDETRGAVQETSRLLIFTVHQQKLSHTSFYDKQLSVKNVDGYYVKAGSSECSCVIEMAKPTSKTRHDYSAL